MGSVGMTPRFRDQYGHKSLQATDRSRSDNLPRNASLSRRHNNTLQPLDEEESAPVSFSPAEEIVSDPGQRLDQETSDGSTFGSQFPTNNTLTRSRSSLQMRDLRDQMQDLKGKISTLKERARKDNMRRRSLQSLRMPSPFTAAQQWQNGAEAYGDGDLSADTRDALAELHSPVGHFGTHEERELLTAEESVYSCEQDEAVAGIKRGSDYPDSIAQSQYEDAEEDFEMEDAMLFNDDDGSINHRPPRDDSLRLHQDSRRANADHEEESISGDQEFYESSPSPMGERHEDREDAFDYEHFFLHSGMGNYSRANSRRRNSYDSTDSGETTKAPTPPTGATRERQTNGKSQKDNHASVNDYASQGRHQRNNSVDSVSTFATFATATEGGGSDGGSDENGEEWEHQQHKYPMAGTWLPDYFSQSNATAANRDVNRPELSSNSSQTHIRSDTALRINGHLTPGSPTGSSTPSTTRSFPLVNKSKHLTPLPSPQPTSSLTSALTASVTSPPMQMSKGDRDLVEKLVESLGKVCVHLHPDGDGNKYEGRVWRRRLDTARRILNGEIDEDGLQ